MPVTPGGHEVMTGLWVGRLCIMSRGVEGLQDDALLLKPAVPLVFSRSCTKHALLRARRMFLERENGNGNSGDHKYRNL